MEQVLKEIGERVRRARLAKGMSQNALADALDVSPSYISKIEGGKNAMTVTVLIGITDTLDVSADWILRNNTTASAEITAAEFNKLMSDCTAEERERLMGMLQKIKDMLREATQSKYGDT